MASKLTTARLARRKHRRTKPAAPPPSPSSRVTLDERIKWARARVASARHRLGLVPSDVILRLALRARLAELDALIEARDRTPRPTVRPRRLSCL